MVYSIIFYLVTSLCTVTGFQSEDVFHADIFIVFVQSGVGFEPQWNITPKSNYIAYKIFIKFRRYNTCGSKVHIEIGACPK